MPKSKKLRNSNILFLVPGFPKDEDDSTCIPALQQYLYHFAKSVPDSHITVITFQYPYTKRKYRWHGIKVYPCGGEGRRRLGRLITWLITIKYVLGVHLKNRVLIIHSFWLAECAFIGQLMSKLLLTKHVASIMGQDALQGNSYLKYLDYSSMVITAGSFRAADVFHNSTGRKVDAIIPIGLDVDNFHQTTQNSHREIDIIGVGALTALKNYALFIEVIAELSELFPDIKAVIIGEGQEYYYLEQIIRERRLEKNIRLLGKLPRLKVIEYMYQGKILLHPSTYESQGYVFLEALYCGLTVVCFDVGYAIESEKMIICNNKQEMLHHLRLLLKSQLDHKPLMMKTIDETVAEFRQLYFD